MTTNTFSYNLDHGTDLSFNQWADRFSQALGDCGLVQTADTGQGTFNGSPLIVKPAANTIAAYQIWRFNDALATGSPQSPIFLKFEFGTDSSVATDARVDLTIGTGSDGAGTLTGSTSSTFEINNVATVSSPGSGTSFFTHSEGFLGIVFGLGGQQAAQADMAWFACFVARSCDATGTPDGNAYFLSSQNGQASLTTSMETCPSHQSTDISSGTNYGTNVSTTGSVGPFGFLPGGDTVNAYVDTNGDVAVFPAFGINPHPFPMPQVVFGWLGDLARLTTFTATPIGTTQRTYVVFPGRLFGGSGPVCVDEGVITTYVMCFQWE